MKEAAAQACKTITKEECNSFVISLGHQPLIFFFLQGKGYAAKYESLFTLIYIMIFANL